MNVTFGLPSPSFEHAAALEKSQYKTLFVQKFCQEIQEYLKTYQYVNFSNEQRDARDLFLEKLKEGKASIEDQGDICRAVCVSIQAAFESLLASKLESGEITQVDILFLTELPCTPLRNPLQEIDTSQGAEWKKWTVDIRTQTVRDLRNAGAKIRVSYYFDAYQALATSSDNKAKTEFEIFELEKQKPNTTAYPIPVPIPKELVGALYIFTDKKGNSYQMATQGIQIHEHGETPKECWKKWFTALGSHLEADNHAIEMLLLVNRYLSEPLTL